MRSEGKLANQNFSRKEFGIYYTDEKLSKTILDFLDIPRQSVVFDPCCGKGSFNKAAIEKGYEFVYGTDIDSKSIEYCKSKYHEATFECFDTLLNSGKSILSCIGLNQKPYCIIGNPPYGKWINIDKADAVFAAKVKKLGNDMFVAALLRAIEMVKDDGIVAYIIPKNFLHVAKYKRFRKGLLENFIISSIINLGLHFKDVRGEQVVLVIKNAFPSKNEKISFYNYDGNNINKEYSIKQSYYNDKIILFKNEYDFEIYEELKNKKKLGTLFKDIHRGKDISEDVIKGKDIQKFQIHNHEPQQSGSHVFLQNIYSAEAGVIAAYGGDLKASQTVTVLTDSDVSTCHYILAVLQSRVANFYLVKYCYNGSRLTAHTDSSYIKDIPLPVLSDISYAKVQQLCYKLERLEYLSKEWLTVLAELDNIVATGYSLDKELVNYINKTMDNIQSDKWRVN